MANDMEWYVYRQDLNTNEIETFNVFRHASFSRDVEAELSRAKSKGDFAEKLKSNLMYYYWCKAEWEVLIRSWCGREKEIKVDVYQQVMLNWDIFLEYVWAHRKVGRAAR